MTWSSWKDGLSSKAYRRPPSERNARLEQEPIGIVDFEKIHKKSRDKRTVLSRITSAGALFQVPGYEATG